MESDIDFEEHRQPPDPELQREVNRAKRDIKLVGLVSIGLIGLMIIFTIVAVLLTYGD